MNKWAKWLILIFCLSFFIPGFYMFGLDMLWDGWFIRAYQYLICAMFLPLCIYPFWRGLRWYRVGNRVQSILFILLGIFMPVVSGLFGVFIFEALRVSPYERDGLKDVQ